VKHSVSAVLSYVSTNFGMICREKSLFKVTPTELALVISHKRLNVKSEDEVIDAIRDWIDKNWEVVDEKEIVLIVNEVNWPYVSFDKLIEIYSRFQSFRANPIIKSIFYAQI
jgi:hypothetical protein